MTYVLYDRLGNSLGVVEDFARYKYVYNVHELRIIGKGSKWWYLDRGDVEYPMPSDVTQMDHDEMLVQIVLGLIPDPAEVFATYDSYDVSKVKVFRCW